MAARHEYLADPKPFQFSLRGLIVFVFAAGIYIGVCIHAPFYASVFGVTYLLGVAFWKFTWGERLTTAGIIAVLAGLLIPSVSRTHCHSPQRRAKLSVESISIALERYSYDFGAYPPANAPSQDGSEVLYHFLCVPITNGIAKYGPYLDARSNARDENNNGLPELISPLGGHYSYEVRTFADGSVQPFILDSGEDKFFGGRFDKFGSFVSNHTDLNADGVEDDQDNFSNR